LLLGCCDPAAVADLVPLVAVARVRPAERVELAPELGERLAGLARVGRGVAPLEAPRLGHRSAVGEARDERRARVAAPTNDRALLEDERLAGGERAGLDVLRGDTDGHRDQSRTQSRKAIPRRP